VHLRQIEIDSPTQGTLDARSVVLGLLSQPGEMDASPAQHSTPVVIWQGSIRSQTTAARSYFVVIYDDETGRCSCPDFHFRGTLKEDRRYACKHIRTARSQLSR
jgi:SWIM zinc finger